MLRKIISWTGFALLPAIVVVSILTSLKQNWEKNAETVQTAGTIAAKKAQAIDCSPATNKNCFNITPAQVLEIQKKRNGLSRKNN